MRKAINENPKVQIALLGGLVLLVAFLLVTRMGGSSAESSPTTSPTAGAATSTSPSGSATATPPATSPTTASASTATSSTGAATAAAVPAAAPVTPSATAVTPDALVPGPGLPAPVIKAWNGGDAVVLLVARNRATDDRLVKDSVEALSEPGVAVFTARASEVARYSRITQAVGVERVPALVVIRPKKLSGGTPQATVSYGFRDSQSVVQAVHDALYSGKDNLPYNPG
jgi:cytoskeletal protein RodZ